MSKKKVHRRRKIAIVAMWTTVVAGVGNLTAFYTGFMSHESMDSITNGLSWVALTLSLWGVVEAAGAREGTEN